MNPLRPSGVQSGFTLLEVLVALTVFTVGALGLIAATRQSLEVERTLEDRTFAGWVAGNRLAELRAARAWPDIGVNDDKVAMAGRTWNVRVTTQATPRPDMLKVEIAVSAEPPAGGAPPPLTGFLGRQ